MRIRYYGHACFMLSSDSGATLLMDPFDEAMGYPMPDQKVDVVTISHGHHDHNDTSKLPEGFITVDSAGPCEAAGFQLTAIRSHHDDANGAKRGENLFFVVEADGLRVAHLGDLGHLPTAQQLAEMGRVDVLLIPVGGYYTIDADQAIEAIKRIAPRIAIPMHYNTGANELPIARVDDFARRTGAEALNQNEWTLDAKAFVGEPKVVVMAFI